MASRVSITLYLCPSYSDTLQLFGFICTRGTTVVVKSDQSLREPHFKRDGVTVGLV